MKTKLFTVRTTRADIRDWQAAEDDGRMNSCLRCPIERFFDRNKVGPSLSVSGAFIIVCGQDRELPRKVKRWLAKLDTGKPVRPITFKIRLPA